MKIGKIILWIFIIFLILFFAFIIFIIYLFGGFSPSYDKTLAKAIDTKNPYLCSKLPTNIPDWQPRRECYINYIIKFNDSALCREWQTTNIPLDWCYIRLAQSKYLKACDEFRDYIKDTGDSKLNSIQCYSSYANYFNYSDACEHLENNEDKVLCYMRVDNSDISICGKYNISELLKQSCYEHFGKELKIPEENVYINNISISKNSCDLSLPINNCNKNCTTDSDCSPNWGCGRCINKDVSVTNIKNIAYSCAEGSQNPKCKCENNICINV